MFNKKLNYFQFLINLYKKLLDINNKYRNISQWEIKQFVIVFMQKN